MTNIAKMEANQESQNWFEKNRESWNRRTAAHLKSKFYDIEAWKTHKNSLNPIELAALGDIRGKSLLHLQCHFGQDSLSLAHLGADVVGVDISDHAIDAARQLSVEVNVPAKFVCCNVYDTRTYIDEKFDLVFTSYGTIGWLPDLKPWAKVVAQSLKPGGRFLIADFHPVLWMMDDDFTHLQYPYLNQEPIETTKSGTYTDSGDDVEIHDFSWNHGLSEIISPLLNEGLQITKLQEFTYSPYNCFANSVKGLDGNYRIKGLEDILPIVYLIEAIRAV
jgi:2-polyprenyl-3-methyl-5-hydroxy-6-metoxy-1,4-benzoquinol methylase